ncbi:hypothetical protein CYMTET_32886 [Cymbomonas tetramitiformis]|uniref:CSD domain-containing protein n=1 Tax=Cymbomonas tetramitiformis TaxID=36881 RepID=A0AAE0FE61_9CHLO|nr:hypothetical protein CYMTET_32886 [Cymbomonas tetramitiformis]|eukprot:gene2019-2709_t
MKASAFVDKSTFCPAVPNRRTSPRAGVRFQACSQGHARACVASKRPLPQSRPLQLAKLVPKSVGRVVLDAFATDEEEDAEEPNLTREEGVVSWFDNSKGYGFLTATQDKEPIFVHYSNIAGTSYRGLCDDQVVQFSRELTPRGDFVARNVTTPDGCSVPASEKPASPIQDLALLIIQLKSPLLPIGQGLEEVLHSIEGLHPKQIPTLLQSLPRARSVEFHRVLEVVGLHNQYTLSSVLQRLVSDRSDTDAAISFLQSFHDKNILTGMHYLVVLKALGEKGEWERALTLLDDFEEQGMILDAGLCNLLFHLAGLAKDGQVAVNLLDRMEEVGVPITERIYEDTILALLGEGDTLTAQSLMDRLWQEGLSPSLYTHQEYILALGEGGQWSEAEEVLKRMAGVGLMPDMCVYNSLIDALGMCGQWERAMAVLKVMERVGVPPGRSTYEVLLEALASGQQWDRMEACLFHYHQISEVEGASCSSLDVSTYQALLQSLCDAGEREKALLLLSQMEEHRIKPSPQCYQTVVELLSAAQEWQAVADILKKLGTQNNRSHPEHQRE